MNWIIHNLYILKFSNSKFITIFYEDLILNFEKVQNTLSSHNIFLNEELKNKNSGSRYWSTDESKMNIKSGNAIKNLQNFLNKVDNTELLYIQKIVDVFEITNYRADNPNPIY